MKTIGSGRFVSPSLTSILRLLAFTCVGLGSMLCARASAETGNGQIFKLREIPVFDSGEQNFLRGQSAPCGRIASREVKLYPEFKSEKPIYGSVRFGSRAPGSASGPLFYFAIDESNGTGKGYDRLYFDLNRDLDLRNDPILKPQTRLPDSARQPYSNIRQQVFFEFVNIDFDCGTAGNQTVELLPRLVISVYGTQDYPQASFVRTKVHEGDIRVGDRQFRAVLGNDYMVAGRLDDPGTALILKSKDSSERLYWWGGDRLKAAHRIDGKFYTFSSNPSGDQLVVRPYERALGTFEVGAGSRSLSNLTVMGSLESAEHAVPVGGDVRNGSPRPAQRCQLPVGEYSPNYLTFEMGHLQISLSDNYHSDGKPRDRGGRAPVRGITLREDQPYVFDFGNPPEVMFASPAKEERVGVGETLEVKAVLVDPKLDIMIRGLRDTARKQTHDANGQMVGYQRNLSLDPTVLITRTNGEKVAEGVMPFG